MTESAPSGISHGRTKVWLRGSPTPERSLLDLRGLVLLGAQQPEAAQVVCVRLRVGRWAQLHRLRQSGGFGDVVEVGRNLQRAVQPPLLREALQRLEHPPQRLTDPCRKSPALRFIPVLLT